MDIFTKFQFDLISFLLGFAGATLLFWLFFWLRKWFPAARNFFKSQIKKLRDRNLVNVDQILRQDVILRAQKNHLLQKLFSLDEVLISPRLLVPPEVMDYEAHASTRAISDSLIPFFPEFTEVTSQYSYPSISLARAIQKNANIAVYGQIGAGKSTALAHLASLLAKRDTIAGEKADCFPIYLHVSDFDPNLPENTDPFTYLVDSILPWYPLIIRSRIPIYLIDCLNEKRLILVLDGLDELPKERLDKFIKYLEILHTKYPLFQLVIACSSIYFGGLLKLGFIPMALASWSQAEKDEFVGKWDALWKITLAPALPNKYAAEVDTTVLNSLLERSNLSLTPLELTLRIWTLYAGDLQDNRNFSAIHSFIQRLSNKKVNEIALQSLAFRMMREQSSFVARGSIESLLSGEKVSGSQQAEEQSTPPSKKGKTANLKGGVIDDLVSTGLLLQNRNNQVMFAHPLLVGFLASLYQEHSISEDEMAQIDTNWSIFECYQHYQVCQKQLIGYIEKRLYTPEAPLYLELFRIARWLKDVPSDMPWRSQMMRLLVQFIHRDDLSLNLRSAFLTAFVCTNDTGVPILLRQIIASPSPQVRQLAALGCGAIHDDKSLDGLLKLLSDDFPDVQASAVLAIGLIKSPTSLKILEELLRNGDERISQAASEILATDPGKGHAVLRSASESGHILIRRAAVIGLGLVQEDWARQIIERLAVQDSQWVVRNIAGQTLENSHKTDARIPSPLGEVHNSPWLLAFAAKRDQGIPVGKSAINLLIEALQSGSVDEKMSALGYLRQYFEEEEPLLAVSNSVQSEITEVSQAALNTLWMFARCG